MRRSGTPAFDRFKTLKINWLISPYQEFRLNFEFLGK
jgi:hypothetical protein